jgi:hypothetical protein
VDFRRFTSGGKRAAATPAPAPAVATKAAPPRPVTVDVTCGDSAAAALRAAFVAGRWDDVLAALRPGRDLDHHTFLASQIGLLGSERGEDRPRALDDLVAARRGDAAAHLLRGTYDVSWAWHARGNGRAKTVTAEQFAVFFERLRRAEQDLMLAARLEPGDPAPWTRLLTSGRGLQIEKPELLARFAQVQRREPGLYPAHTTVLQFLCAKWYGSHEEMFEFARGASAGAPDGSPLHALLSIAHWERYVSIEAKTPEREAYLASAAVRDDLERAGRRALASGDLGRTPYGRQARDAMAYVAGMFRVDPLAVELFAAAGDVITIASVGVGDAWPSLYAQQRAGVRRRLGLGA